MVKVTVLPTDTAAVQIQTPVDTVTVRVETPVVRTETHPEYEGEYSVIPKTTAQTLPTADKIMRNDLTVFSIPYWETGNISGTTVYIGENTIHGYQ